MATVQAGQGDSWETLVSWNQFAWLYMVSLFAGLRALLLWQAGMPGGNVWAMGAISLGAIAIGLRYWVRYSATSQRLVIKNVFTGREIQAIDWKHVSEMAVKRSVVDSILGIGTIVFKSTGDEWMQFRGVNNPETTLRHIQAIRRRRIFPES
jgi:hypothetical protein